MKVADVTQTTRYAKAVKCASGLLQAVTELNKSLYLNAATFTWSLKLNKDVVMYFGGTFTYIYIYFVPWEPGERNQCSVLGNGLDSAGIESLQGQAAYFLPPSKMSRLTVGPTQPPTEWVLAFFPGVKPSSCDVDCQRPSSAQVRNKWRYTSPHTLMTWTGETLPFVCVCVCVRPLGCY